MNTTFEEALKKWAWVIILIVVIVAIALAVHFSHKQSPAMQLQPGVSSTTPGTGTTTVSVGPNGATALVGPITVTRTVPAGNTTFTDPNWSLQFTLRPEWNVTKLPATGKLHQLELSASKTVIFVSQNEAIGLSGDLTSTTSTQTIAGQSVSVKTYENPSPTFAYYQLFTLKESDATYSFLIKSATADTTIGDDFIRSISLK